MAGIDFARSDLSPGLLCEFVLKDEFTFQIPALEIFPKTRGEGGHSYIIEDMDVLQGFSNHYPFADQNFGEILDPLQTNGGTFSKIYTVFPRFTAPARVSALAWFSTPLPLPLHKTSNFDKRSCSS